MEVLTRAEESIKNVPPQGFQAAATRRILAELNDRVTELQTRECDLLQEVAQVKHALDRTRTEIKRYTNLLSAISLLPDEILSAIFVEGQSKVDDKDDGKKNVAPFEMLVSHVCRHWRDVAINTPFLWDVVKISGASSHIELLDAYLDRSGPCGIRIEFNCDREQSCDDYIPRSLEKLTIHIDRWQELIIAAHSYRDIQRITLPLHHLEMPNLTRLVVKWLGAAERIDPNDWDNLLLPLNIGRAPALTSLTLSDIQLPRFHHPLTTLTDLSIDVGNRDLARIPYDYFCETLSSLPSLTSLSLNESVVDFLPEDSLSIIEMPSLLSLSVTTPPQSAHGEREYMFRLFTSLETPCLTSLHLVKMTSHEEMRWSYLSQFIGAVRTHTASAKYQSLQSLRLDFDAQRTLILDADFVDSLPLVRAIDVCSSLDGYSATIIFQDLADRPPSLLSRCWPNLKTLVVTSIYEDVIDLLLSALVARDQSKYEIRIESSVLSKLLETTALPEFAQRIELGV